ncbi:MAG TPA: polysaccharide deacetylase family protein [Bacteroidota bacterium]|nr:polysaccharide deacetylase family protein [Bacteroidota bacterium]
MYHHVEADKFSNSRAILEEHLKYIDKNFNVVLPGDPLSKDRTNICLVFDDASYSFYSYVFPLLRQIKIKVLLAISPKYILDSDGGVEKTIRLSVPAEEMMRGEAYREKVPFCTWRELKEICASGVVKAASHSYSHSNLLQTPNVEDEITKSKKILEETLSQEINSFVYPYGQFNASIANRVRKNYRYSFAVGAGNNKTWDGVGGILFRIAADDLHDPTSLFSQSNLRKYQFSRFRLFAKKWFMDYRASA